MPHYPHTHLEKFTDNTCIYSVRNKKHCTISVINKQTFKTSVGVMLDQSHGFSVIFPDFAVQNLVSLGIKKCQIVLQMALSALQKVPK